MQNELKHHGTLGQKWGIRRFQNPDGSLTALGRLRYGISSKRKPVPRPAVKPKKQAKQVEQKPQKTKEELKAEAMAKADVKYAAKNSVDFTTNEMNDLINRYEKKQKINQYAAAEIEAGKKFSLKKITKTVDDISKGVDATIKAVETGRKICEALGWIEKKPAKEKVTETYNHKENKYQRTVTKGNNTTTVIRDLDPDKEKDKDKN